MRHFVSAQFLQQILVFICVECQNNIDLSHKGIKFQNSLLYDVYTPVNFESAKSACAAPWELLWFTKLSDFTPLRFTSKTKQIFWTNAEAQNYLNGQKWRNGHSMSGLSIPTPGSGSVCLVADVPNKAFLWKTCTEKYPTLCRMAEAIVQPTTTTIAPTTATTTTTTAPTTTTTTAPTTTTTTAPTTTTTTAPTTTTTTAPTTTRVTSTAFTTTTRSTPTITTTSALLTTSKITAPPTPASTSIAYSLAPSCRSFSLLAKNKRQEAATSAIQDIAARSVTACVVRCQATEGCGAVQFRESEKRCWLLRAAPEVDRRIEMGTNILG